jgi:hypothetical protein
VPVTETKRAIGVSTATAVDAVIVVMVEGSGVLASLVVLGAQPDAMNAARTGMRRTMRGIGKSP